MPYFHRITSAVTGARKPLAVRSAPICSAVASAPDGYRPICSRPASGTPFASTTPGSRCVAGSHTHIPYTWRKRRSAIRSLATPFCAHTTGSASAATAPSRHSHRLPGPFGQQRLGVLGLGRQQEDVVLAEAEFSGARYRGDVQRGRAVRGGQAQAAGAQRVEVGAAGDQDDLVPAGGQPAADGAADRAGPMTMYRIASILSGPAYL